MLSGQDEHVVFKYDEGLTTGQPWSHAGQLAALHHGVSEKYGAEHHGIGATQIEARYHNPPRVGRLNCVHLKYSIIAFLKGSYKKKNSAPVMIAHIGGMLVFDAMCTIHLTHKARRQP